MDKNVYVNYSYNLSNVLTKGMCLIKVNKLNGKVTVSERNGLHLNLMPWVVTKRISLDPQKLDTPVTTTITKDSITIEYDTDYMYQIIDTDKYARREINQNLAASNGGSNLTLNDLIGEKLDQMVSDYVKSVEADNFKEKSQINLKNDLSQSLKELENEFGIEITSIFITKIKLPEIWIKQAEASRMAEAKREEALHEKEIAITKAQAEAEATKLLADAKQKEIEAYIKAGITPEAMGIKLANDALTNGTNPNTIVLAAANTKQSNPNFDTVQLLAAFSAMMKNYNNNSNANNMNNNMVSDNSQSVNSEEINRNNDKTPLTKEEEIALLNAGLIEEKYLGNYYKEGLSQNARNFLAQNQYGNSEEPKKVR